MRLINFSVSNYRSFLDKQTIEFGLDGKNVDAVFGANGAGKSNLFQAVMFYRDIIRSSTQFGGRVMYEAFKLNSESLSRPTTFEAKFKTEQSTYIYGFSLLQGVVEKESLKQISKEGNSTTLFSRASVDKGSYKDYGFTPELLKATRDDSLLLTKAWENNNAVAKDIFDGLNQLRTINNPGAFGATTAKVVAEDSGYKTRVLDLLRRADLGIQDVSISQTEMPEDLARALMAQIPENARGTFDRTAYQIMTTHLTYDDEGKVVGVRQLDLGGNESSGTRRMFELAGPILAALDSGSCLYIDEFEMLLHPKECKFIVSLFQGGENKHGAQLIVNTHNTQIMDQVGRNGIHLVGKNDREATVIGVIDKSIRPEDPALEKKYNSDLFGATANIS